MIERAIVVKAPFAGMIVDGIKTLEMRSRENHISERIGVIEARSGLIIGSVDLCGSTFLNESDFDTMKNDHCVEDLTLLKKWNHGWILKNAVRFDKPIKYVHPRGAVTWVNIKKLGIIIN